MMCVVDGTQRGDWHWYLIGVFTGPSEGINNKWAQFAKCCSICAHTLWKFRLNHNCLYTWQPKPKSLEPWTLFNDAVSTKPQDNQWKSVRKAPPPRLTSSCSIDVKVTHHHILPSYQAPCQCQEESGLISFTGIMMTDAADVIIPLVVPS